MAPRPVLSSNGPGPLGAAGAGRDAGRVTRPGAIAAVALLPVLVCVCYVEALLAIGDSLNDIHAKAHHVTGPIWLGVFALLGVSGPVAAACAAWQTRAEKKSLWQAMLRAEMALVLIGVPAMFFLLMA
ncbi:MAG: hypothetical protein ACYCSF_12675 [Acidimicrobiales bacterium]